ncbi:MAG TPA: FAD-binding oxidoreductase [Polyangia bacterium]|nr:FAD-binding oxidoreductase [Polyangia bacterium]
MLSGWGRSPVLPGREVRSEDLARLTLDRPLSRGLGRSYGDSSLPARGDQEVANSTLADRILAFDPQTGYIRAEAGLSLRDMFRVFLPQGFFTPVTPGTQYVTLGGMVAADIHGKNHHREGCFGAHVTELTLRVADGRLVTCSPMVERDLFRATLGGMGLTGHILEVGFRLARVPSPWIYCESERISDIDQFIHGLKEAGPRWPMTVGWIDCTSGGKRLGRGTLFKGRWAEPSEAPAKPPHPKGRLSVPFNLPSFAMGRLSVKMMNPVLYWRHLRRHKRGIVHPETYFYPLDALRNWNRIYGKRGMTQHQCVLPESAGRGAARRFIELLVSRGGASFLCVIKDCGPEGLGLLSFPKPGISIALDIAVRDDTQQLIDALNEQVIKEGGRIYLTKDALTRPEHFRAMEPRLDEWLAIRRKWDPEGKFRSAQSVRLFGDRP